MGIPERYYYNTYIYKACSVEIKTLNVSPFCGILAVLKSGKNGPQTLIEVLFFLPVLYENKNAKDPYSIHMYDFIMDINLTYKVELTEVETIVTNHILYFANTPRLNPGLRCQYKQKYDIATRGRHTETIYAFYRRQFDYTPNTQWESSFHGRIMIKPNQQRSSGNISFDNYIPLGMVKRNNFSDTRTRKSPIWQQ